LFVFKKILEALSTEARPSRQELEDQIASIRMLLTHIEHGNLYTNHWMQQTMRTSISQH
jgi:hypothetical protein